jgi:flavin-dependent dehydrogenase
MQAQVVILGAGPCGSTLGTLLARAGVDVLTVDANPHAVSVVGESLLPFGNRVLELLGVDMSGFQRKDGAVFTRGGRTARFPFAESARPTWDHAYQVEREDFDARLRAVADDAGVRRLTAKALRFDDGVLHTSEGPVACGRFVDAGGRRKFLARQLGLRETHAKLRNAAVHGQFTGVHLPDAQPGDITICDLSAGGPSGGWFWFIPFVSGTTSVGLVMPPSAGIQGGPAARWATALERCPEARERLANATATGSLRGVEDFTSYASRFHGDGWAVAGDAAMFLDPVFSSGVLVALEMGATLADTLLGDGDLDAWEAAMRAAIAPMEAAVLAYYDGSFIDLAMSPLSLQPKRYREGIVSLLAGDLFEPGNESSLRMAYQMSELAGLLKRAQQRRTERARA